MACAGVLTVIVGILSSRPRWRRHPALRLRSYQSSQAGHVRRTRVHTPTWVTDCSPKLTAEQKEARHLPYGGLCMQPVPHLSAATDRASPPAFTASACYPTTSTLIEPDLP
jgi:hypothetical protein